MESLKLNVERLKEYKQRLIIFPRNMKKVKNGDSDKAATSDASQLPGELVAAPKLDSAVTFAAITDVSVFSLVVLLAIVYPVSFALSTGYEISKRIWCSSRCTQ